MFNLMRGAKDTAISMGLKTMINDKLGHLGQVSDCAINTSAQTITIKALLKGEQMPLEICIERYEIEKEGEASFIVFKTFASSREWLTSALNQYANGKRFKLPRAVSGFL